MSINNTNAQQVNTMHVTHLIYTRTQLSDYGWFLGHSDILFLERFERHVLTWLRGNDIVDSVPIITFNEIEGRFVLMKTAWSEMRYDKDRRPILERCAFVWDTGDPLKYGQLAELLAQLEVSSRSQLANIPDDVFRLEPRLAIYQFDPVKLQIPPVFHENIYSLPNGLTLDEIINSHITIEFYAGLSFENLVALIAEEYIRADNLVQLACALPSHLRSKDTRSWLTVVPGKDSSALTTDALYKIQQPQLLVEKTVISQTQPKPSPYVQAHDDSKYSQEEKMHQRSHDVFINKAKQLNSVSVGTKASVFSKLFFQTPDSHVNIEQSSVTLIDEVNRISVLLASLQIDLSVDLIVAWQHLLRELVLSLSYQRSSLMHQEWSRRLSQLVQLTVPKKVPAELRAWVKEITARSKRLMDVLGGSSSI
jgi:hypothetical protein